MTENQNSIDSRFICIARGLALFLGGFTLLNILGYLRDPTLDANIWWIDLTILPAWLTQIILGVSAILLLVFGLGIKAGWLRAMAFFFTLILIAFATLNTLDYYDLLSSGALYSARSVPFSLVFGILLAIITIALLIEQKQPLTRRRKMLTFLVFLISLAAFPSAQIYFFGSTDYRRPADVIIVFGCKAYSDTLPSAQLADRVTTACELYKAGYASKIIMSGGPAENGAHETNAMRHYAIKLGVPAEAILLDPDGWSTYETVTHTIPIFEDLGAGRIIAVSHAYHLPRIKLTYARAGYNVYTVPVAHPTMSKQRYLFSLVRETAAFWAYYLKG